MRSERQLWEKRYGARDSSQAPSPSLFLVRHCARLPVGRAFDVACGDGRNSLYLAGQGFAVDAVDIAFAGLTRAKNEARRRGLSVSFVEADLDTFPLPVERYDVVLNVRYLNRSLLPALKDSVRVGGMVIFETFLRQQADLGHPRNPDFLLERGELARVFDDFDILNYEEGLFETEGERAHLARLLAQRPVRSRSD